MSGGSWTFMTSIAWGTGVEVPPGEPSGLTLLRAEAGLSSLGTVLYTQSATTEFSVWVCGAETITVGSSSSYDFVGTVSGTTARISRATIEALFTVDNTANHAVCGISSF